jgi:hypothetical protein
VTQHGKPTGKPAGLTPPEERNRRFEQQLADSRDHEQQAKKATPPKKPSKPAGGSSKP